MADRRISELSVIPAVAADDALAIVDTSLSETNKVSVEDLLRSAPAGTAAAPSIAFVDDPDTGFYRSAANELSISTGGSQRVVVDDAGNVGIGTNSPDYKFDILGGAEQTYLRVRAGEINSWIAGLLLGDEGTPAAAQLFYNNGTNALIVNSNGSERMRIASNGNVGIGTSSPGAELEISSDLPQFRLTDETDSSYAEFLNNNGSLSIRADESNVATSSYMDLRVDGTERMRITSTGNVGIGTSNPQRPLQIDAAVAAIRLKDTDTTSYTELIQDFGATQLNQVNGGDIRFGIDGEKMRIDSAGNVGIGTSSPGSMLTVNQNGTGTGGLITVSQQGTGDAAIDFEIVGQREFSVGIDNSDGDKFKIAASAGLGTDDRVVITPAGDIGIGTSSPGEKLEVNGTIKATDINFTGLATYADDTAAGTGGLVAGDVYKTSTGELRIKL